MTENDFERDAVRNIQRYLRHLSFHSDEIGDVPIDGVFDEQTRRAISGFQKEHGLKITGVVDRETWSLLKAEYDKSIAQNSPPIKLDLFPRDPMGFEVKMSDKGILVEIIQYVLRELEGIYFFPDIAATGVYDEATAAAVLDFQRRNGIAPSGRVGRETWDALALQHNILLNTIE